MADEAVAGCRERIATYRIISKYPAIEQLFLLLSYLLKWGQQRQRILHDRREQWRHTLRELHRQPSILCLDQLKSLNHFHYKLPSSEKRGQLLHHSRCLLRQPRECVGHSWRRSCTVHSNGSKLEQTRPSTHLLLSKGGQYTWVSIGRQARSRSSQRSYMLPLWGKEPGRRPEIRRALCTIA